MSVISIAEAIRSWLAGGDGKDWHTCSDCNGDGFVICVQWRDLRQCAEALGVVL